jgi:hypothetical protein
VSGLISTLVPSLIVAVVMLLFFILLRKRYHRLYMPRTYIGVLDRSERTPETPTGFFNWVSSMYKIPDTYVLQHHSMDAYLLLRFLKVITFICFVGSCITMPVLWPVNATGGAGNVQFDMLSISNVKNTFARYYAHCFISWIFVGE